ncbi:peroxidasin homolog pxn-2-like [Mercenaria mercenaria]|uniref:peroxidasin homolog pxn-2-like n=1 Tax=Mercenaria mercenaria TaxID=6596 RepID=UPI00234E4B98|nr:peroxidasin homolog pxn-2-like [Mercenaria mercenaria]
MQVLLPTICALFMVGYCCSATPSEGEVKDALFKARRINRIKDGLDLLERELDTRTTIKCPLCLAHGKRLHSNAKMDRRVNDALLATRFLMQDGKYSLSEVSEVHEIFTRENGETCIINAPTDCNFTSIYRRADGSCNNMNHTEWGMAGRAHARIVGNDYDDSVGTPRTLGLRGESLPNARTVSNVIHRTDGGIELSEKLKLFAMGYGQFLDHDFTLTPEQDAVGDCCDEVSQADTDNCFSIIIPEDDQYQPLFTAGYCMEVKRSSPVLCADLRQQQNSITSYIDGSNVYGSLLFLESGYRMATTPRGNGARILNGEDDNCTLIQTTPGPRQFCSAGGDARINVVPSLTAMHYLFVLEHNRIANAIKDYAYDPVMDATIINAFATAAYRFGHTWVSQGMVLFDKQFNVWQNETHPIHTTFHNPELTYKPKSFERLAYWLSGGKSPETDEFLVDGVRNNLFLNASQGLAFDLAALNIQRGRDHGLGSYNDYRVWCNLTQVRRNWTAATPLPDHDTNMTEKLEAAGYKSPRDIDLFTGGITENSVSEGSLGPTFECIL